MRTMTWEEIDKDWAGLQRRHRLETSEAVARYCIGHSMKEVAKHLGYSIYWVEMQLNFAGTSAGLGGLASQTPPLTGADGTNVQKELPKLIKKFGPKVTVDKYGELSGDDADEFVPYLDHHLEQGHERAAAERLARAEWAAEAAAEAGVIKETEHKKKGRVTQILFPDDAKPTFDLDLKMHMARVKAAAAFLNTAKVRDLRRRATCEMVAEADRLWNEQSELVLQHYQPSEGV